MSDAIRKALHWTAHTTAVEGFDSCRSDLRDRLRRDIELLKLAIDDTRAHPGLLRERVALARSLAAYLEAACASDSGAFMVAAMLAVGMFVHAGNDAYTLVGYIDQHVDAQNRLRAIMKG